MNKEELQKQLEKRLKMAINYITINNYFKCQWTKHSNQKIQSGRLNKNRTYNMLSQETYFKAKITD